MTGMPPALPEPSATIESTPVEFSGEGGEYFRIWIVNLLLIMVTLGIYYPWAKVRKLKYFYNNTRIDDHAFEFHGEPKKMLRGTIIAGVLFSMYSVASDFSAIAGLMALVVMIAIAPVLFQASMRFRLANSSWRGMRMRFVAQGYREAYVCVALPLALIFLPGVLIALLADGNDEKSRAISGNALATTGGAIVVLLAIVLPYFFWRIKRFQHNHYAWGPLKTEYRSPTVETYKVFGMTLLLVIAVTFLFFLTLLALIPLDRIRTGDMRGLGTLFAVLIPLLILYLMVINILPRAYFTVRMQNLIWSRTGNRYFRFKSELVDHRFILLQFKNYFLIMITLGLYWPFAVIATQRMKLEAISLKSRVALDKLSDAARARDNDVAGDMAADIFGFDVGM